MHVGTYPTRNFATLGLLELQPPFTGLFIRCFFCWDKKYILLVSFQHRAGIRPYTSFYKLAESCVFSKQSSLLIHCVLSTEEPFIPKLQGEFAEFLQSGYLIRLSIFYLSTCVGLRYGIFLTKEELFQEDML